MKHCFLILIEISSPFGDLGVHNKIYFWVNSKKGRVVLLSDGSWLASENWLLFDKEVEKDELWDHPKLKVIEETYYILITDRRFCFINNMQCWIVHNMTRLYSGC